MNSSEAGCDKWDVQIGEQARIGAALAGVAFKSPSGIAGITYVALIAPSGVNARTEGSLKGRINGQSFELPCKAGECVGFQKGTWIVSAMKQTDRDGRQTAAIFVGFISMTTQPPRVEITEANV